MNLDENSIVSDVGNLIVEYKNDFDGVHLNICEFVHLEAPALSSNLINLQINIMGL